jgi:hypothetical protein
VIDMTEAPRPFWYLAGIAILVVAAAFAYRISRTDSSGSFDFEGFKVQIGDAQQGIDAAEQIIKQLTTQADAQKQEIGQLEGDLAAAQERIKQLVASIQGLPQAPPSVKSSAHNLLAQQVSPPPVRQIDPALLNKAQQQLQTARLSVQRLNAQLNK